MSKQPIISTVTNEGKPTTAIATESSNIVVQQIYQAPTDLPLTPTNVHCPSCNRVQTTKVELQNGLMTYAVAGGICLIGCVFGCCLIPFCIDELKDAHHTCSVCGL